MDKGFPDEGPSFYREKGAMAFTELPPEILLQRGFKFLGNCPKDSSIPEEENVLDFTLAEIKRTLVSRGLLSDQEPRIVISNLDTLVKGSLQAGYETRLVKGEYNSTSGQLVKSDEKIAAFQRFQLDKFLTSNTPEQLKQNGFTFVKNFHLLAWGDNLEDVYHDLAALIRSENEEIENYVMQQERSGVRVQLVKGHCNENGNRIDHRVQGVAIFIKRKK